MKMSKKILSVVLSVVLVLGTVAFAFAADRDVSSIENYLSNNNLGVVAETLLTDLNDRKEEITPTALALVFQFVNDLKESYPDYKDAETEDLAKALIAYLDKVLADANLNSNTDSFAGVVKLLGIKNLDLNSVDGIIGTLVDAAPLLGKKALTGDLSSLSVKALTVGGKGKTALSTKNSDALDIIYGLFGFLGDKNNISLIKTALQGKLSLGSLGGVLKIEDKKADDYINDMVKTLPGMLKGLLYDFLLAEKKDADGKSVPAYADSAYTSFTADELLAAAFINVVSNKDYFKSGEEKVVKAVSKADADKILEKSIYEIIAEYADGVIEAYALDPLNNNLKELINGALQGKDDLAALNKIFNMDYSFTAEDLAISKYGESGIFENLNNILVSIFNVILSEDAKAAANLQTGDNSKIDANLNGVLAYALNAFATTNGGNFAGIDFSGFTADVIKSMSTEDMAVKVLGLFFDGWFGAPAPASADTLEKLGAYAAVSAVEKWMPDAGLPVDSYKALVFDGSAVKNVTTQAYWYDTIATIGLDVATYWLDQWDSTTRAFQPDPTDKTWTDKADTIVTWALNYIAGIPAVADGLADAPYGAAYKANVLLNELFPLSFLNGCGDGATFVCDVENLLMNKVFPAITDLSFKTLSDVFAKNDAKDNPFNKPFVSSTIEFIDHLIFALFEHTDDTATGATKAATNWSKGYTIGKYDKVSGRYIDAATDEQPEIAIVTETGADTPSEPKTEPKPTEPKPTEPKPTEPKPTEPKPTEPKPTEPKPTEPKPPVGMKGDANLDGKVLANDARLVLRVSARLETLEGQGFINCDLNGDGKLLAGEARKILRFSAKLESEL